MEKINKAAISAALIVLICFFMPWVQVSCGAARETETGLDLARRGAGGLWLIPLLMIAIILAAVRVLPLGDKLFQMATLLSGLVSAYLMNQQRLRFDDASGILTARMTGWFWLGIISSFAVVIVGIAGLLRRPRSP